MSLGLEEENSREKGGGQLNLVDGPSDLTADTTLPSESEPKVVVEVSVDFGGVKEMNNVAEVLSSLADRGDTGPVQETRVGAAKGLPETSESLLEDSMEPVEASEKCLTPSIEPSESPHDVPPRESADSESTESEATKEPTSPDRSNRSSRPSRSNLTNNPSDEDTESEEHGPQQPEAQRPPPIKAAKVSPPQAVEYPIDAGIIRCVCGFDHDDGFTIQCEKCNAWQHAICVNIKDEEHVPDIYLCDQCGDLQVDVQRARGLQTKRLVSAKRKQKSRACNSESAHTSPGRRDNSNTNNSGSESAKIEDAENHSFLRRSNAPSKQPAQSIDESIKESGKPGTKKRKRRLTEKDILPPTPTNKVNNANIIDSEPDGDDRFPLNQEYQSHFIKIDSYKVVSAAVESYLQSIKDMDLSPETYSLLSPSEFDHIKPCKVSVRPAADPTKQQRFTGFTKFGLFAESSSPKDRFIIEHLGEVLFQDDYKRDPINQYRNFGCPKQGVLFVPDLIVAVDGRRWGSEAAFIRRSCKPSAKLSTIFVKERMDVHFAAFAIKPIKVGSEITIGWDWDPNHPVQRLLAGEPADALSKEERRFLVHCTDMLQQRGMECACNSADCIIIQMKQAEGISPRNTRGGSRKAREVSTGSIVSETAPIGNGISPMFYSAREERKLQGAMSLLEKEEEKRRKRTANDATSVDNDDGARGSISKGSSAMVNKSIQTEPVVKKLRASVDDLEISISRQSSPRSPRSPSEMAIAPQKRRLMEFLSKRQAYLRTSSKQPSPPSSANHSPTLGFASYKASPESPHSPKSRNFTFRVPASAGLNRDLTGMNSSASSTPMPSPGFYSLLVQTSRPVVMSDRPSRVPVSSVPSLVSSGNRPTAKKKLSFADYKKKQSSQAQPSSDAS